MPKEQKKERKTLGASLKELEKIAAWFDAQEAVDVEKGIAKAKEGAELIKQAKKLLTQAENDFQDITKDLEA